MDELNEAEISTRRGMLRALTRGATRRAREGAEIIGPGGLQGLLAGDQPPGAGSAAGFAPVVPATPALSPARVPIRAASLEDLLSLAHTVGLTERDDELRALACRSLRMTPTDPRQADGWILTSEEHSAAGGEALHALVNLAAASSHDCGLPDAGWLGVFVTSAAEPAGSDARRAHAILLDMPAAISNAAEPVALAPELVLPRLWHEAVQALDLDEGEAEAYDRLRTRLQVLQGVENDAGAGTMIAYHRLLGYPNETTGAMPADCVRAARTWSGSDEHGRDSIDAVLPSREWRLLVQLSVGSLRRTYVWIRRADLEAGNLSSLCAFVR